MSKHTLSVLVENKPGVLARVAGLFSRRAFNIHSLAVGPTEHPEISRITVVVDVEDLPLEQVTKQLNKLIHVLKIVELEPERSVQRELLLVKVRADARQRAEVLQIVDLFRAHVVDVSAGFARHRGRRHAAQARRAARRACPSRRARDCAVRNRCHRPRRSLHHGARAGPRERLNFPDTRTNEDQRRKRHHTHG